MINLVFIVTLALATHALSCAAYAADGSPRRHKKIDPNEQQQAHEHWRDRETRRRAAPLKSPEEELPPPPGPAGLDKSTKGKGSAGGRYRRIRATAAADITKAPYKWTGKLFFVTPDGANHYCTAEYLPGVGVPSNIIMTAAHCVYDRTTNAYNTKFSFWRGFNVSTGGTAAGTEAAPDCVQARQNWIDDTVGVTNRIQWDVAFLRVLRINDPESGNLNLDISGTTSGRATSVGYARDITPDRLQAEAGRFKQTVRLGFPNALETAISNSNFTYGVSGGSWIKNPSGTSGSANNISVSLNSAFSPVTGGVVMYGPIFGQGTADLKRNVESCL